MNPLGIVFTAYNAELYARETIYLIRTRASIYIALSKPYTNDSVDLGLYLL